MKNKHLLYVSAGLIGLVLVLNMLNPTFWVRFKTETLGL